MADWITITQGEVLEELSSAEAAMMTAVAGDKAATFVSRAVDECRGAIAGGGYPLGPDATIPPGLASDVLAIARWRWLIAFPTLAKMQTPERKDAFETAQKKLEKVSQQKFAVEAPGTGVVRPTGSWNSENKLIPRTHPVPKPTTQFQSADSTARPYANPDADAPQDA